MSDKSNPYGAPDTGHVWDDTLRELTNQPPKWWMIGFHASWIVVLAYGLIYPMWPMVTTHTKGFTGWTAVKEYKEDLQAIKEKRAEYEDKIAELVKQDKDGAAAAMLADDKLSKYIENSGKVLFGDNCAACHGTKGIGNPGFPVLNDDDWLWGGDIASIEKTITDGRQGSMPAKGMLGNLTDEEIDELAQAVFENKPTSTPLFAGKGMCTTCHGPDGAGMHSAGSANLTDGIYRFVAKDQLESIKLTIRHGVNVPQDPQSRNAVMPKFGGGKLSDTEIKKLAVYVFNRGGGVKTQPAAE